MDLLTLLPWPIKAGWILVIFWTLVQLVWYQFARVLPAPPPRRSEARQRSGRRETAPAALPAGGSSELLAEIGLHDPDATSTPSVYQ